MQLHDALHDQQAQSAVVATPRAERGRCLEQLGTQRRGYPGAIIGDADLHAVGGRAQAHLDLATLGCMAQRVVEQVGQHPLDQAQVRTDQRQAGRKRRVQLLATRLCRQFELLQHVLQQLRQREHFPLQPHFAVLQPRQFEQRARQPADLGALCQRNAEIAAALIR